jgi:hypothetical protein
MLIILIASVFAASSAMAAERKLIRNTSPYSLQVTLVIRRSEDPRNNAGTKDVDLPPKTSQWVEYGDHIDRYLNGIGVRAHFNGEVLGQQYIVVTRGGPLDAMLNTENTISIIYQNGSFHIGGSHAPVSTTNDR